MEKPNIPKAKPSQEDRDKIQEQLLEELAYLQPVQHGIFIITVHVTALQKIFCQTPALAQRLKRVCTTLKSPKRSGKSRHGILKRYRYNRFNK